MFHLFKRAASSVANAAAGKVRFFIDAVDGLPKVKDEAGMVTGVIVLLGGSPSVTTAGGVGTEGSSSAAARADHSHTLATGTPVALGASASAGSSSDVARADHVHPYPTAVNVGADPTGTAASAVVAHEGAADPHPQYTTTAEAAAAAPVQSVNGATGAVTVNGFTTIAVPSGTAPVADQVSDTLTIAVSGGATVVGNAASDTITFGAPALASTAPAALGASADVGTESTSARADHVHAYPTAANVGADAAGTAAAAVAAHVGLADPHPQYLTVAEGNAVYQPLDTDLSALAGLAVAGMIARTGPGAVAARTIQGGVGTTVTNGGGVAGDPVVDLDDTAVTPGTYGSETEVAQVTVDQQGRITNVVNVTIPEFVSSVLSATQSNNTTTPAVLTGHTIVIPAGRTLKLNAQLAATSGSALNGMAYGLRVAQGAGADGNAQGSVAISVAVTSAAANSALNDGDVFNVAANANARVELLATASTGGNNYAALQATIINRSTNVNTTVTIEFRSENNGVAITAQIGTAFSGVIH